MLSCATTTKADNATPQEIVKITNGVPVFITRTSPMGLYNLIHKLLEEQKQDVKDIVFGSLLLLDILKYPVQFSRQIISLFDFRRRAIILKNGSEIEVDKEDVQCVLNISRGSVDIQESIGVDSDDQQYVDILRAWRRRWGIQEDKGAPRTLLMLGRMIEHRDGHNNFKRDFVIYVVSSFLLTTQSAQAR